MTWTVILASGQITVEDSHDDRADSMLTVTDGTATYHGAFGVTRVERHAKGTEFDIIYRLDVAS